MEVILFISALLILSYSRGDSSSRDAQSLSYASSRELYLKQYSAAYRRAIGFVNSNTGLKDDCYSPDGKARKCTVSEFGNIALNKQVSASSTCGNPPNRYCNRVASPMGGINQCYVCDANHKDRMNPPEFMIDLNQKTCWVSQTFNDSSSKNEVAIQVSLGKKYELTYMVIPFCNKMPESISIFKSADFGRKWTPLQYYSSDCQGMYGLEKNGLITKANEQAAICKDLYSIPGTSHYTSQSRIAFSLVDGRPSAPNLDTSPVLRDWITVTDVKLVFNRLNAPNEIQLEKEANYYSLSELTLGGRCKCNGHASHCITDPEGVHKCDCKHNTDGQDCDRCKDFYVDRPWSPATNEDANECVACDCNQHSRTCVFNMQLYVLSGKISGGVCIKCKHNTDGIRCHYCKDGFYRDPTVPITHRKACKACHCHPYGSLDGSCYDDGQCNCKEGVTGQRCDRCKPGYTMTKSITSPCQKIGKTERDSPDFPEVPNYPCDQCKITSSKLDLVKYCKSVFAIKALVKDKESLEGNWVRFSISIEYVYKRSESGVASRIKRESSFVYVHENDLRCRCPKLRLNKTYIMIGANQPTDNQDGLLLDRDSIVVRYKDDYDKRIKYYKKEERRQSCYKVI